MRLEINRHEGKLTGLAASYGEPTLMPEMLRHFSISAEDGRIDMDFPDSAGDREFLLTGS